jgi:chromosomal replication initiation ATPase DnaA
LTEYLSLWRGVVAIRPPLPTMKEIASDVAQRHGLSLGDLQGRSLVRKITNARQEAMWAIYLTDRFSLGQVARFFNRADHTTVWHAIRAHEGRSNETAPELSPPGPAKTLAELNASR